MTGKVYFVLRHRYSISKPTRLGIFNTKLSDLPMINADHLLWLIHSSVHVMPNQMGYDDHHGTFVDHNILFTSKLFDLIPRENYIAGKVGGDVH